MNRTSKPAKPPAPARRKLAPREKPPCVPATPADTPPPRCLDYGEASRLLKCSDRTVRRYVAAGKLVKYLDGRGIPLVTEASVRALLRVRPATIYL